MTNGKRQAGMFNFGDVEILRVEESLGRGFRPKTLLPDWNAAEIAPHLRWLAPTYYDPQSDRIVASVHSWVLKTRHHTILIDTCVGNHKERPDLKGFHMLNQPYLENLAAAGLKPGDIDYVLCTHLHVDHVGWNTRLDSGRWVPTFPNAKYVFSKTDRDYFDPARGEGGRDEAHARVFNDSVLPILEGKQEMLVDGATALGDDLTIEPAPGHSPGHVLIALASQGAEALFTGDIMHHPIQIHYPGWSSSFCSDPEEARQTRRRLLERAATRGSVLYPAHFAGPHIGRVAEVAGGFVYVAGRG
jgi:glyoxylase-like metal-dependent hydrolase (beta-lactamase superfamily II)